MSVVFWVAMCLDAGSTPAVSIDSFQWFSLEIQTFVLKGLCLFLFLEVFAFCKKRKVIFLMCNIFIVYILSFLS